MMLIHYAPRDRQILLLLPAFDTHSTSWWIGYYSYVEKRWILKTPYTINNKSVICSDVPQPIGWRELPPWRYSGIYDLQYDEGGETR